MQETTTTDNTLVKEYLTRVSQAVAFVMQANDHLQQANAIIATCLLDGVDTTKALTTVAAV